MALSSTLIASIIAAIIETAIQGSVAVEPSQYAAYLAEKKLPPEAKQGVMSPPKGDGIIYINGEALPLSPVARFRNEKNLIVMPMSILEDKNVIYLLDNRGAVFRVWMVPELFDPLNAAPELPDYYN